MVSINASDTEYLGSYVTQITYYEEWDEMVLVTHTRTVSDGNGGTRTETYTTLERQYHLLIHVSDLAILILLIPGFSCY